MICSALITLALLLHRSNWVEIKCIHQILIQRCDSNHGYSSSNLPHIHFTLRLRIQTKPACVPHCSLMQLFHEPGSLISLKHFIIFFPSSSELLSGCALWSAACLFWQLRLWSQCDSTAGHFIITALSSAVSLNQPGVSKIDFFLGGWLCISLHSNPWNFFSSI